MWLQGDDFEDGEQELGVAQREAVPTRGSNSTDAEAAEGGVRGRGSRPT
jgi:hypothetical protein